MRHPWERGAGIRLAVQLKGASSVLPIGKVEETLGCSGRPRRLGEVEVGSPVGVYTPGSHMGALRGQGWPGRVAIVPARVRRGTWFLSPRPRSGTVMGGLWRGHGTSVRQPTGLVPRRLGW